MSLTQLATLISPVVGRPVKDQTGLDGTFDLDLRFTPEGRREGNDPVELSIFTAVREQLGLKLDPAKSAVDFLVIDHVERPSENQQH